MDKNSFIKQVYTEACKLTDGISPIFTVAQAALESGWGKSAIGNNLFGITIGSKWTGKKQLVLTTEYFSSPSVKFKEPERVVSIKKIAEKKYKYSVYRYFRDYDSIKDCLLDHQKILKGPLLSDAWPYRNNPIEFTKHLVDKVGGKYATDPNYVSTMTSIIKSVEKIINDNIKKT